MPFIKREQREHWKQCGLAQLRTAIRDDPDFSPGDLAYMVYVLLMAAAPQRRRFAVRNAMMGAVDEARLTYRRYIHDPAEDVARMQHGDID